MTTTARKNGAHGAQAHTSCLTTGIGSLPHHNVDAALDFSFRHGIPFLPQIPIRNPWEYMIAQALEGIPGLLAEKDGLVVLDADLWNARASRFGKLLGEAFAKDDFERFEPSAATSSSWQPFIWELEERGLDEAKVQIAGPLTCQWALRLKDGRSLDADPSLAAFSEQGYHLLVARAIAMVRRLKATGIKRPIFFIDEPGLYAFQPDQPRHVLAMQELRFLIQALKREGAEVGVHCCSNAHWPMVLELGFDILSIDAHLSLAHLISTSAQSLDAYLARGGRLALGVVPTSGELPRAEALVDHVMSAAAGAADPGTFISRALFTPACGLALSTPSEAENILALLTDCARQISAR